MQKVKRFLQSLRYSDQLSLNTITIKRSALRSNLTFLQSLQPDNTIFPVLKSNAYGHGLKEVSMILKDTNVPYICVDSFPEYQIVKDYAHKKSLILGETRPENYTKYDPRRATLAVYNIATLKTLIQSWKKRHIHLFLNTGMNREWIQEAQLIPFLDLLQTAKSITLEWVMSHFANADEVDSSFDIMQIEKFKHMYARIQQYTSASSIHYRHINNSAGTAKHHDPLFNAHRAGIAFYGYNPLQYTDPAYALFLPLQPALTVSTTVVALQQLDAQDIVSYGAKRTAPQAATTATIPFGYYEWLSRKLTNNREIKWQSTYLPLVGTICMNLSCVDTKEHRVQIGDIVEIISASPWAPNSIGAFAEKTGTIPYEVLVKLNERTKRVIDVV